MSEGKGEGALRTVIVSGASRGVGLAVAERLAAAGFRVVAIARTEGQLADAQARCAGGGEIVFRPFDLSQVQDIGAFVRDLRGEFVLRQPGIEPAGVLPDELQLIQMFTAAIVNTSRREGQAKRLIEYLVSDQAAAAIRASGMEPAGQRSKT